MVVGIVLVRNGKPVCSELWPGNTADVKSLVPVVEWLKSRFGIGSVSIVADCGMIRAETLAEVERRKWSYIVGVRDPSDGFSGSNSSGSSPFNEFTNHSFIRSTGYVRNNSRWTVNGILVYVSWSMFLLHMGFEMFHESVQNLPLLRVRGAILGHPEVA
jgi:hypothetical protein